MSLVERAWYKQTKSPTKLGRLEVSGNWQMGSCQHIKDILMHYLQILFYQCIKVTLWTSGQWVKTGEATLIRPADSFLDRPGNRFVSRAFSEFNEQQNSVCYRTAYMCPSTSVDVVQFLSLSISLWITLQFSHVNRCDGHFTCRLKHSVSSLGHDSHSPLPSHVAHH